MSDSQDVLSWRRIRPLEHAQPQRVRQGPPSISTTQKEPVAIERRREQSGGTSTQIAAASGAAAAASKAHGRLPRLPAAACGPATPLNPLNTAQAREKTNKNSVAAIGGSKDIKALPHPATYAGSDNWALTPNSSLPSLPGTPNRPTHVASPRPGSGLRLSQDLGSTSPSRPPPPSLSSPFSAVRGHDSPKQRSSPSLGSSIGGEGGSSASTTGAFIAQQVRSSPKPSPAVARRSVVESMPPSSIASLLSQHQQQRPLSSGQTHSSSPAPTLQHRDSMASLPTSSHPLSHSRRSSQIFQQPPPPPPPPPPQQQQQQQQQSSPASSVVSSARPPSISRPYRPPMLRGRDSIHSLKPRMIHYDRVRTPSLRGQSRSPGPDPTSSTFRASISSSRAPSEVFFSPPPPATPDAHSNHSPSPASRVLDEARLPLWASTRPARGTSRLSSFSGIGPDEVIVPEEAEEWPLQEQEQQQQRQLELSQSPTPHQLQPQARRSFDTNALFNKLSNPRISDVAASVASTDEREAVDDVDFSPEDMMQLSLTDSFYMSRNGSVASHGPVADIFEIGDRIGPGMTHDGHRITIAATSEGFESQERDLSGSQLQVVRKLGEGSYAVVYLVREISSQEAQRLDEVEEAEDQSRAGARPIDNTRTAGDDSLNSVSGSNPNTADQTLFADQTLAADQTFIPNDTVLATTLKADGAGRLATADTSEQDLSIASSAAPASPSSSLQRHFALKCLCKRDLSPEMLEVQRLEATIHQSIPTHPYIVTLYRTYETPEWLFLVLEYCPGQDLYFWLEQARDGPDLVDSHDDDDDVRHVDGNGADKESGFLDSTPPSPSILASTAGRSLLSRRRLRLVSRMFRQMCEAIQFCHDRGISHRDIKPENFIVEDRRQNDNDDVDDESVVDDSEDRTQPVATGQIVVKLTDFGLAVAQDQCVDFDCGSKPYMAFECRNNVSQHYDPRQADVWSLGVVLLNLVFHRSPFSEPNPDRCDSFRSYCIDPVEFLTLAFDGLTQEAAEFLAEHVFCDVTSAKAPSTDIDNDDDNHNPNDNDKDAPLRTRISARELGQWAKDLPRHLGVERGTKAPPMSRGADVSVTSPMEHSRSVSSSRAPSLLASPNPTFRSLSILGEDDGMRWDRWPSLFPEYNMSTATASEIGSLRGSPAYRQRSAEARTPSHTSSPGRMLLSDFAIPSSPSAAAPVQEPRETPSKAIDNVPTTITEEPESSRDSAAVREQPSALVAADKKANLDAEKQDGQVNALKSMDAKVLDHERDEGTDVKPLPRSASHSRRRKRGPRKGRAAAKQLHRSRSAESVLGPAVNSHSEDIPGHIDNRVRYALPGKIADDARKVGKPPLQSNDTFAAGSGDSAIRSSSVGVSVRARGFSAKTPSLEEHGSLDDSPTTSAPPRTPHTANVEERDEAMKRAAPRDIHPSWHDIRHVRPSSTLPVGNMRKPEHADGSKWGSAASRRERMLAAAASAGGHSTPLPIPIVSSTPSAAPGQSSRSAVDSQRWWRERIRSHNRAPEVNAIYSSSAPDISSPISSDFASADAAIAKQPLPFLSTSNPRTGNFASSQGPTFGSTSSSSFSSSLENSASVKGSSRGLMGVTTGLSPISERHRNGKTASFASVNPSIAHGGSVRDAHSGANSLADIFDDHARTQRGRRSQRRQQEPIHSTHVLMGKQQQNANSLPSRSNISVMRPDNSTANGSLQGRAGIGSASPPTTHPSAAKIPPSSDQSSGKATSASSQGTLSVLQDDVSTPASAATNPRKKMLGKFLLGVKNYNKGIKVAAPPDERHLGASSPLSPTVADG